MSQPQQDIQIYTKDALLSTFQCTGCSSQVTTVNIDNTLRLCSAIHSLLVLIASFDGSSKEFSRELTQVHNHHAGEGAECRVCGSDAAACYTSSYTCSDDSAVMVGSCACRAQPAGAAGIIYCLSRQDTESVASYLHVCTCSVTTAVSKMFCVSFWLTCFVLRLHNVPSDRVSCLCSLLSDML